MGEVVQGDGGEVMRFVLGALSISLACFIAAIVTLTDAGRENGLEANDDPTT